MSENPPAFPPAITVSAAGDVYHGYDGMTLRDYFAIHADQPGVSEIVSMAGGETDGFMVAFSPNGAKTKFNDWWNALPLADRCMLSARVRYALADAMLAARSEPRT